jgi:hypothetical protein
MIKYIYAGFEYFIEGEGNNAIAVPVKGQHPAANKQKHCLAAIECWRDDGCPEIQDKEMEY